MATREDYMRALRDADAAGDTAGAKRLAELMNALPAEEATLEPTQMSEEALNLKNQLGMLSSTPLSERSPEMNLETAEGLREQTRQQNVAEYENLEGWKKPIVAGYDTLSNVTDLFGLTNMLGSGAKSLMTGQPYDEIVGKAREQSQASMDRAGGAGVVGNIAGDIAALSPIARLLPTSWGVPTSGSAVTKAAGAIPAAVMEGRAMGALDAAGHGEDVGKGKAAGGMSGAIAGPLGSLASSGLSKIAGLGDDALRMWRGDAPRNPPRPSGVQLENAKNQAYRDPVLKNTEYAPQAVQDLSKRVNDAVDSRSTKSSKFTTPQTFNFNRELQKDLTSGQPITPLSVDLDRQLAELRITNPNEADLVGNMRGAMDEFMGSQPPTTRGNSAEAWDSLQNARDLNRRSKNVKQFEKGIFKDDLSAEIAKEGNWGGAVRTRMKNALIDTPENFNEVERDALEKAARGFKPANIAGKVGSKLTNPWVTGLAMTGGGFLGGAGIPLALAATQGGGRALKGLANRSVEKSVTKVMNELAGHKSTPTDTAAQKKAKALAPDIMRILELYGLAGKPAEQQTR